ncbi:MAG TPA: hypothetical protein VGL23_02850 [Chloroflexota bacterium]
MSYTLRQRIYPALGKEAEVRAQLTDWVKHLQGQGRDVALLSRLLSSEGLALVALTRANDLAEIERQRRANLADPDWQARAARVVGLLRAPVEAALFEAIVEVPTGAGLPAPGIVARAQGYPAVGKEQQARSIVEEFARAGQQAGLRQGASARIYSSEGSMLEVTTLYADLAELDRVRKERAEISRQAATAFHELSRAPIAQRIFEVVVPFPNR